MKFVFSTSKHTLSKIIRYCTCSPLSHFSVEFDDGWMIQASIGGVKPTWWYSNNHKGFEDTNIIHAILIPKFEYQYDLDRIIEDIRLNYLGEEYDYFALIGFLFVLFGRKYKINIHNFLGSSNKFYCSEILWLINDLFKKKTSKELFTLPKNIDREEITPMDGFMACYKSLNFATKFLSDDLKKSILTWK